MSVPDRYPIVWSDSKYDLNIHNYLIFIVDMYDEVKHRRIQYTYQIKAKNSTSDLNEKLFYSRDVPNWIEHCGGNKCRNAEIDGTWCVGCSGEIEDSLWSFLRTDLTFGVIKDESVCVSSSIIEMDDTNPKHVHFLNDYYTRKIKKVEFNKKRREELERELKVLQDAEIDSEQDLLKTEYYNALVKALEIKARIKV